MQREGSALHGLGVVILKELSDHLTSVRMRVLEWLVVLFARCCPDRRVGAAALVRWLAARVAAAVSRRWPT